MSNAWSLWYVAPGAADLRQVAVRPPGPGEVLIETLWSGLSRGTERLVFTGRVPASERERMRAPWQEGEFSFPVKYGYAAVGRVVSGPPEHLGRTVFCLHPHQDRFLVPAEAAVPVPDSVPARRAVLAANMETALNALWDAGAGPGDRIAIVGAGVVGLLVASLAARLPGASVTVVDIDPDRARVARALGAAFRAPTAVTDDADVVIHTTATAAGLSTAICCAAFEATVVELSWYGEGTVAVPLGGAFHAKRLALVSSQVGAVSAGRRVRVTHRRRLELALALLEDPRLDALLTEEVAFRDLPAALPRLLAPGAPGLATAIRYS